MKDTGADIHKRYKETPWVGLAANVIGVENMPQRRI